MSTALTILVYNNTSLLTFFLWLACQLRHETSQCGEHADNTTQHINNVCKHTWRGWINDYINSISRHRSHFSPMGVWGPCVLAK